MLKNEFEYYLQHQAELADKHKGKFLVIKGQKVLGVYDSELEAVEETAKSGVEVGTFLVQKSEYGDDNVTQTFHSRVSFPKGLTNFGQSH